MMMSNDDLNISGQFSPPHEPEEPSGFGQGAAGKMEGEGAEIDSPYAMDTAMKK